MENPIKMDDLGVHLFLETPMSLDDTTWQQDVPIMLRLPVVEQLPGLWLVPHVRDLQIFHGMLGCVSHSC